MAPYKSVRTYQKKDKILAVHSSKSVEVINALFAQNLSKRLKGKTQPKKPKVKLKELPPRTAPYISDDSIKVNTDNTFDKLLTGGMCNKVEVKDGFEKLTSSESDVTKSRSRINVTYHSPLIRRRCRKRPIILEDSSTEAAEVVVKHSKHLYLDKSISDSLSVEQCAKDNKPNVPSLSYIKLPEIKEHEADKNSLLPGNSYCRMEASYEPIFSETFKEKQLVHSSTPYITNTASKIVADQLSPIKNNESNLIEISYDEIQKWGSYYPIDYKGTPQIGASLKDIKNLGAGSALKCRRKIEILQDSEVGSDSKDLSKCNVADKNHAGRSDNVGANEFKGFDPADCNVSNLKSDEFKNLIESIHESVSKSQSALEHHSKITSSFLPKNKKIAVDNKVKKNYKRNRHITLRRRGTDQKKIEIRDVLNDQSTSRILVNNISEQRQEIIRKKSGNVIITQNDLKTSKSSFSPTSSNKRRKNKSIFISDLVNDSSPLFHAHRRKTESDSDWLVHNLDSEDQSLKRTSRRRTDLVTPDLRRLRSGGHKKSSSRESSKVEDSRSVNASDLSVQGSAMKKKHLKARKFSKPVLEYHSKLRKTKSALKKSSTNGHSNKCSSTDLFTDSSSVSDLPYTKTSMKGSTEETSNSKSVAQSSRKLRSGLKKISTKDSFTDSSLIHNTADSNSTSYTHSSGNKEQLRTTSNRKDSASNANSVNQDLSVHKRKSDNRKLKSTKASLADSSFIHDTADSNISSYTHSSGGKEQLRTTSNRKNSASNARSVNQDLSVHKRKSDNRKFKSTKGSFANSRFIHNTADSNISSYIQSSGGKEQLRTTSDRKDSASNARSVNQDLIVHELKSDNKKTSTTEFSNGSNNNQSLNRRKTREGKSDNGKPRSKQIKQRINRSKKVVSTKCSSSNSTSESVLNSSKDAKSRDTGESLVVDLSTFNDFVTLNYTPFESTNRYQAQVAKKDTFESIRPTKLITHFVETTSFQEKSKHNDSVSNESPSPSRKINKSSTPKIKIKRTSSKSMKLNSKHNKTVNDAEVRSPLYVTKRAPKTIPLYIRKGDKLLDLGKRSLFAYHQQDSPVVLQTDVQLNPSQQDRDQHVHSVIHDHTYLKPTKKKRTPSPKKRKSSISPQKRNSCGRCSHKKSSASLSDIIESSQIIDLTTGSHPDFDDATPPAVFKKPKPKIILKPGKSYRRSLSLVRRSGLMWECNKESCQDGCSSITCNTTNQTFDPNASRRSSVQIVPVPNSRLSILGIYAHETSGYVQNKSYTQVQQLQSDLEESIRSISLSEPADTRKSKLIDDSLPIIDLVNDEKHSTVTAKELVLRRCGQTEPLPFEECYPPKILSNNCQKIGEGVYGEVFLYRNQNGGTTVMKIIPIEGDLIVNGERQKKFEEILSEIIIAMELSNLKNGVKNYTCCFNEVQKITCVQGHYPAQLLDLWELYEETRGSENDSPKMFAPEQLYIILELANGGQDMEAFVFHNAMQAFAMFKQTACALAVAESQLKFEHRDLHWGNILLKTVDKEKTVRFCLEGDDIDILTHGVEVAIIDFTLSRMEFDGVVIFNDLSQDEELFLAKGDYQFEIYRLMQNSNRNEWQHFRPYTNVLWLHYILDKAVNALRYKNVRSKIHKEYLKRLEDLKEEILTFMSVEEFFYNVFL